MSCSTLSSIQSPSNLTGGPPVFPASTEPITHRPSERYTPSWAIFPNLDARVRELRITKEDRSEDRSEAIGFPQIPARMMPRFWIETSAKATILAGLIAIIQVQALVLLPDPTHRALTRVELTTSTLFHGGLILDISGALLSFALSRVGSLLDTPFTSPLDTGTLHAALNAWQPFVFASLSFFLNICGWICFFSILAGSTSLVIGFFLHVWSQQPPTVAWYSTAMIVAFGLPLLGFVLCGIFYAIFYVAILRRARRAQRDAV